MYTAIMASHEAEDPAGSFKVNIQQEKYKDESQNEP
jgi:hypothetical protein